MVMWPGFLTVAPVGLILGPTVMVTWVGWRLHVGKAGLAWLSRAPCADFFPKIRCGQPGLLLPGVLALRQFLAGRRHGAGLRKQLLQLRDG